MSIWFAPLVRVTVGLIERNSGNAHVAVGVGPGLANAVTEKARDAPASCVGWSDGVLDGPASALGADEPLGAELVGSPVLAGAVAPSVAAEGSAAESVAVLESLTTAELVSDADALGSANGAASLR